MKTSLYFYRGTGFYAAVVRWWTKSPFDHVAPVVMAAGGQAVEYDAFWDSGVTRRVLALSDPAPAAIVPLREAVTNSDAMLTWLEAQVGKKYDKWSIVIIGLAKRAPAWLHIYVSRQGEWTCSRLACVFAGQEQQAWGLRWPVTPGDLYTILTQVDPTGENK